MRPVNGLAFPLLLALFACGDGGDLHAPAATGALQGDPTDDALVCPFADTAALDTADAAADFASNARLGALAASDLEAAAAPANRIRVHLDVQPLGSHVVLRATFRNPYRCGWYGHLFIERELPYDAADGSSTDSPGPNVETLARRYRAYIPAGGRVRLRLLLDRPGIYMPQEFVARAYAASGADRERYDNCVNTGAVDPADPICPAVNPDETVHVGEAVLEATWEEPSNADPGPVSLARRLLPCPGNDLSMHVDLSVEGLGSSLRAMTAWLNANRGRLRWAGDLYVDVAHPSGRLDVLRRDLRMVLEPGKGFCTVDQAWLPSPGVYLVASRALRRDGSDRLTWLDPGTTEIYSVCNGDACEGIEPLQERAASQFTGESAIWLRTDFFSEFTRVTMAYGDAVFDITEQCTINQWIGQLANFVEVRFDTMNLPIGPNTWARYTVELNPMPVVPDGAKLTDSLWVLTNGPE